MRIDKVSWLAQIVDGFELARTNRQALFDKSQPDLIKTVGFSTQSNGETCASAHHWGRELQSGGYTVRLIPPTFDGRLMPFFDLLAEFLQSQR